MRYTVLGGIRNTLLKTFIDAFNNDAKIGVNKLYLGLGKDTEWDNSSYITMSTDDNPYNPDENEINTILSNINDVIKVNSNEIIPVIPHKTFSSTETISVGDFVRSPSNNAIYECLHIGSTPTNDPGDRTDIHNNGETIFNEDGFQWKYVWHLSSSIVEHYMSVGESDQFNINDDYMPISYNLYHPDSTEHQIQQAYGISQMMSFVIPIVHTFELKLH